MGCTSFCLKLPNLRSSAAISSGVSADSGVDVPLSASEMYSVHDTDANLRRRASLLERWTRGNRCNIHLPGCQTTR